MAYANVAVQQIDLSAPRTDAQGSAGVSGGGGSGLEFSNDGHIALQLTNTGVGTPNVVIEGGISAIDGLSVGDLTIALVASQTKTVGPFKVSTYNQPGGSSVQINFTGSNETDVRVLPIRI